VSQNDLAVLSEGGRKVMPAPLKKNNRCWAEANGAVVLSAGDGLRMEWAVWDGRRKYCSGIGGPQFDDAKRVGGEKVWP